MSKEEFYNEIKRRRSEELFLREFQNELADILARKREGNHHEDNFNPEYMTFVKPYQRPAAYDVGEDDKHHSKLWESLMKD